jgi:hypothetical protein
VTSTARRKRPQTPEPAASGAACPDGAELTRLLDAIAGYLRDAHAGWEHPDEPETLALWIIHTWFIREYDFTKVCTVYPWITSHDPDCGKSTIAYALKLVCPGAVIASPTVAAITKFLNNPENRVLIIDQFHNLGRSKYTDEQNLYSALANGHAPGTDAMITGKDGNIEYRSTFYPKVFIGLDAYKPDEEIRSRCIRFRFRPCTDTEQTELEQQQARHPLSETGVKLSYDIRAWATEDAARALDAAMLDIKSRTLNDGTHLTRRESDNFRMLFALADAAGRKYPMLIRDVAARLTSGSESPDPDETEADRIDTKIRDLARTYRLPVENWHHPGKPPLPDVPGSGLMLRNIDLGYPRPRNNARDGLPVVTLIVNIKERKAELRILPDDISQIVAALGISRSDLFNAYRMAERLHAQNDKTRTRNTTNRAFRSGEPERTVYALDFTKVIFGKQA